MKRPLPSRVDEHRVAGPYGTHSGACVLKTGSAHLRCIFSNGLGWDHVSVSLPTRCPTWAEMEFIKRTFFADDETAMQLHVPLAEHISHHPYCLHIWRPQSAGEIAAIREEWGDEWPYGELESPGTIPRPPSSAVGPTVGGERRMSSEKVK